MQYAIAAAALAGVAMAAPQGVTARITPDAPAPAGCSPSFDGLFQITVVQAGPSSKAKRADGDLILDLTNGVLIEQTRMATGYIADNYQFQFDNPPQTGAIYTAGFSACSNGSLALGGSAIFYQCLSGDFYNLYDRHWAPQCEPVFLDILPQSGSLPAATTTVAPGQGAPSAVTSQASLITAIPDGQPQGPTAPVMITSPVAVVTQIGDGQPQGPTVVPTQAPYIISQIGDGQPQAPTAPVVSQIGDGQPQAPTAVVSQIGDGQPQAPTGAVSQIGDGQIQAPTGALPVSNTTTGALSQFTGAANALSAGSFLAAAAGAAVAYVL